MSLAKLRKLDADGVTFQSHLDGSTHRLTPARSIEIQHLLDATITMVLDECTPFPATPDEARASDASCRCAGRSGRARRSPRDGYGLFGIVQGSVYPDLREASAEALRRDRLRRLCDRRTGDRRRPGHHVRRARRHHAASAGGCAALSDGRGHARRHHRRGAARHRHVRLRDPDTRRPHRARLYLARRRSTCAMRASPTMRAPLDADMRLPGLPRATAAPICTICSRREEMLGPMLLTWHNVQYYQDLMRGLRAAIAGPPAGRACRCGARRVGAGGAVMTEENYAGLTQLGHHVEQPASPDAARLERVANPSRDRHYVVRLHLPGVHLALPDHRPAGLRPYRHRLHPARLDRGEQVAEALSHVVPQPRRVPRGLHDGDRRTTDGIAGSGVAAHRRLLVSARRHSDRRVLADRRAAGWCMDPAAGRGAVSWTGYAAAADRPDGPKR